MVITGLTKLTGVTKITSSISGVVLTYATLNPSDKSANITLSNGNLTAQSTNAGADYQVRSTLSIGATDKIQWECTFTRNTPSDPYFVIGGLSRATESVNNYTGFTDGCCVTTDGNTYQNAGFTATGWGSFTDGQIATFTCDANTGILSIYRDGSLLGTITGLSGVYYVGTGSYQTLGTTTINFGEIPFTYPQSGFTGGLYI